MITSFNVFDYSFLNLYIKLLKGGKIKFYDLNIKSKLSEGDNTIQEIADFAKKLGYTGVVINEVFESVDKINELKEEIAKVETDIEIYPGVTIQAQNIKDLSELKNTISKVRDKVLIVTVAGGDYRVNRLACEDPRVDILTHPELDRIDGGLDEPSLKAAVVNNVIIEINFKEVLNSFRKPRSYLLNHIATNIKLCDHFRVPIVVSSSAKNIWDMRPPREMVALINSLGLDLGKAFAAVTSIPQTIIKNNKKTLDGTRITEGVEIVE